MIAVSAKGAFTIADAMIAQAQRMAFAMKCFRYIGDLQDYADYAAQRTRLTGRERAASG